MNKSELIDEVAKQADISKVKAGQVVDAILSAIEGAMKSGDSVTLVGFGTFAIAERAARTGRNPSTGAPLQIPASRVPQFRAGKNLKDAANSAPAAK